MLSQTYLVPPTGIGRTLDQRTDEFYNSNFECTDPTSCQYRRHTLMEFDHRVTEQPAARGQDAEQPNLNDAMSTLIVRPKYWVRKVNVITLAEVFDMYIV